MDRKLNLNRAETFSFINPWIRYFLFFFSFLFWVFSLLIVAIGVYAKVQKATDTVRDTFLIDPAVILIVVGVVMFFITFCGCIGALRENIHLLKTFKCCGWNNYTDWSWNLYFNCTQGNPSSERCAVPYSCCTPVPGEVVINTKCGFGVQTQNYLEATKSIYPVGCADRAVRWIESHLLLVGALALGLSLPQVTHAQGLHTGGGVGNTSLLIVGLHTTEMRHRQILDSGWDDKTHH
uniref:tetraspanin-33b isoform X5 n=1 Tax=Oncorhynchus gorbuscha TaxID=8017 RepID=UPI001EAED277|nr:tetraspanin-33b isoform X5 [Oncorhynchus gorbuscha]